MSEQLMSVNQAVRQVSSYGRIGKIVEINDVTKRYRVLWTHESNGKPVINSQRTHGVRTWVQYKSVTPIQTGAASEGVTVK